LLQETAGRLAPQAGEIRIEVMGPECVIPGDRELLSLLADNLTVNAIRASSPGQTVTLTATERGFMVRDEGLGMTEEQLSHVFEPFYRADKARSRSLGGAGLGLSLCRRIAELHRGKLHFASSPGEGTVVTVTTCLQPVEDSVTPSDVPYDQEVMHP
jgi:signal transduction histidine kinase